MAPQPSCPLDVVIVIPSFNLCAMLAECLEAASVELAASGLKGRIVVVDNASWDGSSEMVRKRFPAVTLLENEVNQGFSVACNQGGRLYRARYVLLLNSDAQLLSGSLRAAVDFADTQPRLGALTGRLLSPSGHERYPARYFWQRWWPPSGIHELAWVPGTCALLCGEALDEVGWLDEEFFFYNEDLDLSWRLKKANWRLFYHPGLRVVHQEGGSSRFIQARALLEGYRGTLRLCLKHYGPIPYEALRCLLRLEVRWRLLWAAEDGPEREAYEAVREVLRWGPRKPTSECEEASRER